MIKSYYRSPYVQKVYGLGGIFRSVAKLFRLIVRNIRRTINRPEVKNVLKTVGKETLDTGSELLINSIKGGNDIGPRLDKRIEIANQRIVDSIEDGISMGKRAKEYRKYDRLDDNEYLSNVSNKSKKRGYRSKQKDQVKEDVRVYEGLCLIKISTFVLILFITYIV